MPAASQRLAAERCTTTARPHIHVLALHDSRAELRKWRGSGRRSRAALDVCLGLCQELPDEADVPQDARKYSIPTLKTPRRVPSKVSGTSRPTKASRTQLLVRCQGPERTLKLDSRCEFAKGECRSRELLCWPRGQNAEATHCILTLRTLLASRV